MTTQMTNEIAQRPPMQLTSDNVQCVFRECIANDESQNVINIHGVSNNADFDIDRIDAHRSDIIDMLNELPETFHVGHGGGWSFLNMCVTRYGEQWTDLHHTCDMLLCLGIAIDAIEYCIKQRDLWRVFPGSMPYITVDTTKGGAQ